jgi:hypothetical protein
VTGKVLWTAPHLMDVDHDASLGDDVVVIGGGNLRSGQRLDTEHQAIDRAPVLIVLDARTGEVLSRLEPPSTVRWTLITPEQDTVVGLVDRLIALDGFRGVVRWTATSEELRESRSAIALPERIIVRTMNNRLWQIESLDGSLVPGELAIGERIEPGFDFIEVAPMGDRLGIATARGVAILDRDGQVVGMDARVDSDRIAPAAFARNRFVHATTGVPSPDNEHVVSQLTLFEMPSGRAVAQVDLTLWTGPRRVAVIDGHIIVSGSFNSVLIDAPPTEVDGDAAAPPE